MQTKLYLWIAVYFLWLALLLLVHLYLHLPCRTLFNANLYLRVREPSLDDVSSGALWVLGSHPKTSNSSWLIDTEHKENFALCHVTSRGREIYKLYKNWTKWNISRDDRRSIDELILYTIPDWRLSNLWMLTMDPVGFFWGPLIQWGLGTCLPCLLDSWVLVLGAYTYEIPVIRGHLHSWDQQLIILIITINNNNNTNDSVYGAVIILRPLQVFTQFIWWMQTEHRMAANPQTKPTYFTCESTARLIPSTSSVAVYYYYSARKLILIYRPTEDGRLSRPRH